MKAVVFQGGDVAVRSCPKPKPGIREVLVRPLYTGVAVADARLSGSTGYTDAARTPAGTILGHEFGGVVEALGEDAAGLQTGQRCAIDPRKYCGDCLYCRAGFATHCTRGARWIGITGENGGLAELCVVPDYACFPVAPQVTDLETALVEPLCRGTRAVRLSGMAIGDNIGVLGADDTNLGALRWARLGGAQRIIVVDPTHARRRTALDTGADDAIDPAAGDVTSAVRKSMHWGADLVFVSIESNVPASEHYLRQACEIARPQGVIVIARVEGNGAWQNVPSYLPLMKEISFRHFGNCFGEEPWRGGRQRGDWQLTLDAFARRDLTQRCLPVSVIDFDDVDTGRVREIFRSVLVERTKAVFRIAGVAARNDLVEARR